MIIQKNEYMPLPQPLKIIEIKSESATTKTFTLDGSLEEAKPGQFVMVWLPDQQDKPFSLAGCDPLKLTIAAVGPLSQAIHRRQVGDYLWLRGPFGSGFQLSAPSKVEKHILLIGGGYGVAPLHFLAKQALEKGYQVSMIIGARSKEHLLLVEDFQKLEIPLWLTTEDGTHGQKGRVTDVMVMIKSRPRPVLVCACGPTGMLKAIADYCHQEKIPVQLAWESYMRCAMGLCGSCEVGEGWLTCLDGPVFKFDPFRVSPNIITL